MFCVQFICFFVFVFLFFSHEQKKAPDGRPGQTAISILSDDLKSSVLYYALAEEALTARRQQK